MTWAQSGVSGQATIHLEDGGTLCNGAARVVALRVKVTGLTGSSGETAGLNASLVQITLNTHVQAWYARTLDGSISSSWPFRAIATNTSQVVATGNLKVVGWAAGDTPNQDYFVAQLVFSGPETSTSGDMSLSDDNSLPGLKVVGRWFSRG
ncbi:MAG: hypothetical protein CSA81_09730 [Acidobacteria bacterium]|nr:MAG: hypothetical protein CSA81_09730 [Acidobacteriota bacterium]